MIIELLLVGTFQFIGRLINLSDILKKKIWMKNADINHICIFLKKKTKKTIQLLLS